MASRKPHSRVDSRISVEPLEARNLRTVTLLASGELELRGTIASDFFAVEMLSSTEFEVRELSSTPVGAGKKFLVSAVTSVVAKLHMSNDTLLTQGSVPGVPMFSKPMLVYGDIGSSAASGGSDRITTGAGNDTVYGHGGGDRINTGDGNDEVYGYLPVGSYLSTGTYQDMDIINTGSGNDAAFGGPDRDSIVGDADSDSLCGNEEKDTIFGGTGRDTLDGGGDSDTLSGDDDNDSIFGGTGYDDIAGGLGNDTIDGDRDTDTIAGGDGDDQIHGGDDGGDFIDGGVGNDVINGGLGNETISGGAGNDSIAGEGGSDLIAGESGEDTIRGGDHRDELDGGTGNDSLYGDEDNDGLRGGDGHDNLYGGTGMDDLEGGAGLDGLVGGDGVDDLTGGSGADRFLDYFERATVIGRDWEDDHSDFDDSEDALIGFKDGSSTTSGGITWAAAAWTESEVEDADVALRVLHVATENDELLEQRHNDRLTFVRIGNPDASTGIAGWNGEHKIYITNNGTTTSVNLLETFLHEIGHHWDDEWEWSEWKDLSDWRTANPHDPDYAMAVDGSGTATGWWYLSTADFVRTYGRESPFEDFATCFAAYFANLGALYDPNDIRGDVENLITDSVMATKNEYLDDFVTELRAGMGSSRSPAVAATNADARADSKLAAARSRTNDYRSDSIFSEVAI